MNQVFAGGIALIIALILWSSKKQLKGSAFFKSQKDSFSKAHLTSSALIIDKTLQNQKSTKKDNKNSKPFSRPTSLNSIEIKKQLNKLISSNPNDRLLAIQIASQWNNKKALPFLRRGLKDSDSRVVIAAATGISSYKGKTIDLYKKPQVSRRPRNVSLIR
ncbi:HEAT repeat domain-containing protein [Prochlorococcus sp. MIT 0801]|uniref:HEAT repeat domain-containing protein n=1 Tax=Prochlorococcus sp. MIT 0801 TaxID=1501269 RepID=UPI0004F91C15|nr:HEAT repeat domain-containing protein [Prochlorococcus sp. MIT 0801]AIQ98119.1 putative Annexin [Prochlorococcus sp. MIT 0801]